MARHELEAYLDTEGVMPLVNAETEALFDIFDYWMRKKRTNPILYRMHLDYSTIQGSLMFKLLASSAPCERIFSSAKHVIGENRTSLKDDTMDMLMMEKHHLKPMTEDMTNQMNDLFGRMRIETKET